MVGGRNIKGRMQLNRALSQRQPGSTIKPLAVYGPAIEMSATHTPVNSAETTYGEFWSPVSIILDEEMSYKGEVWPRNWYGGFRGPQMLRTAIEQSENIPAVKVQLAVGDQNSIAFLKKLGITTGLSFVIPWAIFLGAIAQLYASAYDFNHNNVFGATIFGAFAFFWLGVATSWLIATGALGPELQKSVDGHQIGYAFFAYFLFALAGTIAATETNKALFFDMIFIDLLLFGLAIDSLGGGVHWAHSLAAYAEAVTSAISLYAACATFLNKFFGRPFWPVGKPLGIFKKG
jgi:succinate-acetate transporter protein